MFKFFYQLGHCSELGIAEYSHMSQFAEFALDRGLLFTNTAIQVNQTGSIVSGGELLYQVDSIEKLWSFFQKTISDFKPKEVGISILTKFDKRKVFEFCKQNKKRVTVIDKFPNFGYWKKTNNWLIITKVKKQFALLKVNQYSDQGFWSKLDDSIPHTDMQRGVINLKLARSLLNLTEQKNIWDPFVGQGRLLIAGMDKKHNLYASDIDKSVIPQMTENIDFSYDFWKKTQLSKEYAQNIATLKEAWVADAITSNLPDEKDLAIVTEGYLGSNFKKTPTSLQTQSQVKEIDLMWADFIRNLEKNSDINEVVGCVPFYPSYSMPEYTFLKSSKQFKISPLTKKAYLIAYSRPKTFTGHLIFKLVRK